jgi:hypothetical protein
MYAPESEGLSAGALTSALGAAGMESGPAAFAGVVFVVFGAALLLWTGARLRAGEPVVEGKPRVTAAVLSVIFGVISFMTGGWVLLSS